MSESPDQIKAMIKERFVKAAPDPAVERKFSVGPERAKRLGYAAEIDALPPQVTESFAEVDNPLALGELRAGEVVLDLGCGAGLDSLLAARRGGPTGRVVSVDMTGPMVEKSRANALAAGIANAEFHRGEADGLSLDDGSEDVVISLQPCDQLLPG